MELKRCSKCSIEKDLIEFCNDKSSKDGLSCKCKECSNNYYKDNSEKIKKKSKSYYEDNKDIISQKSKEYREKNKDIRKIKNKEYYEKNKDIKKIKYKEYREKNKENKKIKDKEYREKNKEYFKEYNRQYREKNSESLKLKKSEYYEKNKEKLSKRQKIYNENKKESRNLREKERRISDNLYRLTCSIRGIILKSFMRSGYKKNSKTSEILGCSFDELKIYLESKFESWMSWENKGLYNGELNYGWDIDHIIPLSSAETEDELIKLNHYTNLQPLCSKINRDIKKDNNYEKK